MMKRFALLAAAVLVSCTAVKAQDVEGGTKAKPPVEKPSRDFVMFQVTYDGWQKPDSVKTTGIGRGINAYICYDFPIKKSNFSFAVGLGIGTSNIYLNNQEINVTDTAIKQAIFQPESADYKKYKLTTAYLEAPFELRFFGNKDNRNKGFKAAVGLRAGTLLGAHTKAKNNANKTVEKESTKQYLESWRVSATARIGWGNFSLFGAYNLINLYKEGSGPVITPYSIGIALTGL
ncbi:MAG: hypothetical protein EOP51_07920 [Sphingobacteriales bacterium]|nr:MAG: hypothetical protein EOP51_07920 [Sphingobacteriales bacterium]